MLRGYKTFIISLLITIFGALEAYDFTAFLTADNAAYTTAGIGALMFVLRAVTKTPMFNND